MEGSPHTGSHTHTQGHTRMHTQIHMHTHRVTHTQAGSSMHAHTDIHAHTQGHTHADHTHVHTHTHIHTHMHTLRHRHPHTHTPRKDAAPPANSRCGVWGNVNGMWGVHTGPVQGWHPPWCPLKHHPASPAVVSASQEGSTEGAGGAVRGLITPPPH